MMSDQQLESECLDPDRSEPLEHELGPVLPALAALPTRDALARSPLWARHGPEIGRLTRAIRFGFPTEAATPTSARVVRIVSWNIERGKEAAAQVEFLRRHPILRHADVLLLNEVDLGMARSDNVDVASTFAEGLGLHHVFGACYLCLDSGNVRDGGTGRANALGLAGNAILSRFPIRRAENVSLTITKEKFLSSEKRLGHKKALWAELRTPLGDLAVAAVHLDSSCSPAQRGAQLRDLLRRLEQRGVLDRCVVGGDLNTTTYDLASLPRLAGNILLKLARGGFPHAIHHYVHPQELYESPTFAALEAAGLDWQRFNAPAVGTSRYEVGTFDSESKIRDYLPEIFVRLLAWRLRPWNGVAPLKIDWLSGRGVRPLGADEIRDGDRGSVSPAPFAKPRHDGRLLSDHDPIVVDVTF